MTLRISGRYTHQSIHGIRGILFCVPIKLVRSSRHAQCSSLLTLSTRWVGMGSAGCSFCAGRPSMLRLQEGQCWGFLLTGGRKLPKALDCGDSTHLFPAGSMPQGPRGPSCCSWPAATQRCLWPPTSPSSPTWSSPWLTAEDRCTGCAWAWPCCVLSPNQHLEFWEPGLIHLYHQPH